MVWLFAAVVLVLAVLVPSFRKVLLIGAGVIAALGLIIALNMSSKPAPPPETTIVEETKPTPPPHVIPADKIQVKYIRTDSASNVSRVSARLFNTSDTDTLSSADYRLLIDDCESAGSCATVHDERFTVNVTIPPGQARDVELHLGGFDTVRIMGKARVRIEITAAHPAPQ